jgi:hypothetical protein
MAGLIHRGGAEPEKYSLGAIAPEQVRLGRDQSVPPSDHLPASSRQAVMISTSLSISSSVL